MQLASKLAVFLLSVAVVLSGLVGIAGAQGVDDFRFTQFDTSYKISNDDPQGFLEITETMTVDYSGQNRGILRALPMTYNENDLNIVVLDVQRDGMPENYITYEDNGNLVLQIGNPDVVITGEHVYAVSYSVENVITFYEDHDELFWNVNGTQWGQPFGQVTAKLKHNYRSHPTLRSQCFTGNSNSQEMSCEVSQSTTTSEYKTTRELLPGETMSIVYAFEKGYFSDRSWIEKNIWLVLSSPLAVLQIGLVTSAARKWRKFGKDRQRRPVAPFYGRPKNVSLLLADYVANNKLTTSALSATIIDLSIRGYLQIVERKEGRKTKHDLVVINDDFTDLATEERQLIDSLFGSTAKGDVVQLDDMKTKLHGAVKVIKTSLDRTAKSADYYDIPPDGSSPKVAKEGVLSFVVMIIGVIIASRTNGVSLAVGLVGLVGVIIFAVIMTRRSRKGAELKEHMDGLKLYLDMAEKDRLEQQDAVEAPLAPRSGQPVRDVQFFEKLLPFAIALGVEKTWAEAFVDIYKQPPEWFNGSWNNGFNSVALANSLQDTTKTMQKTFAAPGGSSGSGFSGGGAGGGGGGGGGGGW